MIPSQNQFWFLPLGGSGEIGMNLNLYGYNKQWLMVDLGVTFSDRFGIDIISPDPSFIVKHKDLLKGIVLTHAHEDHLGAVPYLWQRLQSPVYATPFTAKILKGKLAEFSFGKDVPIIEIPLEGRFKVGDFELEYVTLTHSIPEPNAILVSTPLGKVFHTGDWKIDPTPLVGEPTNKKRLKEIGKDNVLAMVCDSTNVFTEGVSGSEDHVRTELMEVVGRYTRTRIAVCCFASNIARIQTIMMAAKHYGRKVCLLGRSMQKMVDAAQAVGYLKDLPDIVDDKTAMSLPRDKVLMIMTGSQGEPRSALTRIAFRQHPTIFLDEGDVVLFSSRVIPGNEKAITALQNALALRDITTITSHEEDIHVSGHPSRDELKQMYEWVKPQTLIPVHGEHKHLKEHGKFGKECGIKNIVVPKNGTLIDLLNPHIIDEVPVGRLGYDGKRMIPLDGLIVKDRVNASINGVVSVAIVYDQKGNLKGQARIMLKGITQEGDETKNALIGIQRIVQQTSQSLKNKWSDLDHQLFRNIRGYFKTQLNKKPVVLLHIIKGE